MKRLLLALTAILLPLCSYAFYPDSAHVVGNTYFWAATGEMSGNRTSIRDSNENIHVVFSYIWDTHFHDSSEIYYVFSTDHGLTWSNMENISHTDSCVSFEANLAVDSQNRLHCIWKQYEGSSNSFDLYYTMYNGNVWSIPENITQQYVTTNTTHYSSLVVDTNDHLHVVYDAPYGISDVFYLYYDGVSWSTPVNISNVVVDAAFPCIAVDSTNNLHVIWRESGRMGSALHFPHYLTKTKK